MTCPPHLFTTIRYPSTPSISRHQERLFAKQRSEWLPRSGPISHDFQRARLNSIVEARKKHRKGWGDRIGQHKEYADIKGVLGEAEYERLSGLPMQIEQVPGDPDFEDGCEVKATKYVDDPWLKVPVKTIAYEKILMWACVAIDVDFLHAELVFVATREQVERAPITDPGNYGAPCHEVHASDVGRIITSDVCLRCGEPRPVFTPPPAPQGRLF